MRETKRMPFIRSFIARIYLPALCSCAVGQWRTESERDPRGRPPYARIRHDRGQKNTLNLENTLHCTRKLLRMQRSFCFLTRAGINNHPEQWSAEVPLLRLRKDAVENLQCLCVPSVSMWCRTTAPPVVSSLVILLVRSQSDSVEVPQILLPSP